MDNIIISNARKALEHRIDEYFTGEEVMAVPRSIINEWLDSQIAITYFESASQFNKEHKDYVRELEETIIDLSKCCSDLRKENDRLEEALAEINCECNGEDIDRLEEALSLAEADRDYAIRELDKVTTQLTKSREVIVKLRDELNFDYETGD